jgi:hypothetical protein
VLLLLGGESGRGSNRPVGTRGGDDEIKALSGCELLSLIHETARTMGEETEMGTEGRRLTEVSVMVRREREREQEQAQENSERASKQRVIDD